MVAHIFSVVHQGFHGALIDVETDSRAGLPGLQIVGMGNKSIDEARERVKSAIRNSSLEVPAKKLTVNLAPAELPKDGTALDVAIALSILVASGQLQQKDVEGCLFIGELALDGTLRPARGVLAAVEVALRHARHTVFIPSPQAHYARLMSGVRVIAVRSLKELYLHLKKVTPLSPVKASPRPSVSPPEITLDSVKGHSVAKRALVIAVSGRHHLLLTGPPGAGKTLLAQASRSLLPPLSQEEALEVALLHTHHADIRPAHLFTPPFRAPHHRSSPTALIGGGPRLQPGEISLAHKGVLFLDELPEFPHHALEALRQPLEEKYVTLTRAHGRVTYPADALVIAARNPCPCGYATDPQTRCSCLPSQAQRYALRLSGPLLDRFDLRLQVQKQEILYSDTSNMSHSAQHSTLLRMVHTAKERQLARFSRSDIYNSHADESTIRTRFEIDPAAAKLIDSAQKNLSLSTRGILRVLRVARTIADLSNSPALCAPHVAEALQYRE